jgi:hypothetical protein
LTPLIMKFIDEKGRLFGMINIVDLILVIFLIAIITTILVYVFSPPRVNETEDVIFQVYFVSGQYTQPLNKAVAHQFFVEGNEFAATIEGTKAVITDVQFIRTEKGNEEVNVLVTLNATLRIGVDGQYLFNGLEIAPGKMIGPYINGSYFRGTVHRINYNHYQEIRKVSVYFETNNDFPEQNIEIIDYTGNSVGVVFSVTEGVLTRELESVYGEDFIVRIDGRCFDVKSYSSIPNIIDEEARPIDFLLLSMNDYSAEECITLNYVDTDFNDNTFMGRGHIIDVLLYVDFYDDVLFFQETPLESYGTLTLVTAGDIYVGQIREINDAT